MKKKLEELLLKLKNLKPCNSEERNQIIKEIYLLEDKILSKEFKADQNYNYKEKK